MLLDFGAAAIIAAIIAATLAATLAAAALAAALATTATSTIAAAATLTTLTTAAHLHAHYIGMSLFSFDYTRISMEAHCVETSRTFQTRLREMSGDA